MRDYHKDDGLMESIGNTEMSYGEFSRFINNARLFRLVCTACIITGIISIFSFKGLAEIINLCNGE